jgi:ribosomal protein L37AE/L43A
MKDQVHKQGERCSNEKEKRERYLAAQLRYATKPWTCTNCNITILIGNKTKHLKSKKHFKSLSP